MIRLSALIFVIGIPLIILLWVWQNLFHKNELVINTNRTAVIKEIRKLNRLETASFTIEKIIDAGTAENNFLKDFLFGDKILLIAHGEVVAGFDFSMMDEHSLKIENKSITFHLPPPQILFSRLDNTQTRVYDRRQGILNQDGKNLESQARQAAEQSIVKSACEGHILDAATDNARKQLTALFTTLGFTTVSLDIPAGECE